LFQGLQVRPLRRWLGTARFGFLWKKVAYPAVATQLLAEEIRDCIAKRPKAAASRS
jgi:hypothetical protein